MKMKLSKIFAGIVLASTTLSSSLYCSAGEEVHVLMSIPPGKKTPKEFSNNLENLSRSGLVDRVVYLSKTGSKEGDGFERFAIVEFIDEDSYSSWKEDGAKAFNKSVRIRRADVLGHDSEDTSGSSDSKYVVSYYQSRLPVDGYKKYTDDYIVPNMMNQRWSGIMSSWTMYFEREQSGTPANAVLVMEYKNDVEYARRSEVKKSYKKVLIDHHPKWNHINSVKDSTIRIDLTETYADPVVLK